MAKQPAKKRKATLRGNRPPPELTEDRARQAWEMRCANYTLQEIGKQLGIHHTTVHRALERIRKEDYELFASTREQHKIDQTRQLEHIASQAMRSWEKSKEPQPRVRETTNEDGDKVTVTDIIEREGTVSYLHLVLRCMEDIRKIWGFDVLPAAQDVGSSLAGVLRRLDEQAKQYEAELKSDGTPGDPGGAA